MKLEEYIDINNKTLKLPQKHLGYWLNAFSSQESAYYILDKFPEAFKVLETPFENLDYAFELYDTGRILEFGVATGTTINYIAEKTEKKVDGFDSFQGLPESWNQKEKGAFAQNIPNVRSNVELHIGMFEESLDKYLKEYPFEEDEIVGFLHIDCDLYSSTKTIFKKLAGKIGKGTVIVFDEYFNYPNWKKHEHKAFIEFIETTHLNFRYISYVESGEQVGVIFY